MPVLGNCPQAALLLDSVRIRWVSAARSYTGVRVDTIASCLILADGVQELTNVGTGLLVAA